MRNFVTIMKSYIYDLTSDGVTVQIQKEVVDEFLKYLSEGTDDDFKALTFVQHHTSKLQFQEPDDKVKFSLIQALEGPGEVSAPAIAPQ